MNPQLWWYLARSSGLVAWALLTASMVWGLLLSTRLLQHGPTPKWLLDLHRHLGGLALAFTALHLATLWADSFIQFSVADLLIPFATDWKPGPVALGILSLYLLVAVEATSLAMKRLPRVWWRRVHLTSYPLFWIATLHGITAGTDANHPAYWAANTLAAATVVFLTLYRALAGRRARNSPATDLGPVTDRMDESLTPQGATRPPGRRQHRGAGGLRQDGLVGRRSRAR